MNIIKKVGPKNVCGPIKKVIRKLCKDRGVDELVEGETFLIYRVAGKVNSCVEKDGGDFGISICLMGDFRAQVFEGMNKGKEYSGIECFLSNEISNVIKGYLEAPDVNEVTFGYDVSITIAATTVGYQYLYETLIELEGADPLAEFMLALPPPALDTYGEHTHESPKPAKKKKAAKKKK